ncbi:MAG: hypothetical protein O2794_03445 [bacterium]|nr:hypothetical protein [bacterium]
MTELRSISGGRDSKRKRPKFSPKKRWRGLTLRQRIFIIIAITSVFVFGYSLVFVPVSRNSARNPYDAELRMPGSASDSRPRFRVKDLCSRGEEEIPFEKFVLVCR